MRDTVAWSPREAAPVSSVDDARASFAFTRFRRQWAALTGAAIGADKRRVVERRLGPVMRAHDVSDLFELTLLLERNGNETLIEEAIDATSAAGFPSVITFSGLRKGMPDDVGLENTVAGLKTVIGHAERKRVTLCLEVLNSRIPTWMIGVPDYMCDSVEWAVEVCRRVGSPRLKVLFDIFHVQVMQGDLITRIRQYHAYVGHYHTAGVPGRHEIDQTQEINYPAVMRAIAETGFAGYVAQEFLPTRDPLASLREAVKLCSVK